MWKAYYEDCVKGGGVGRSLLASDSIPEQNGHHVVRLNKLYLDSIRSRKQRMSNMINGFQKSRPRLVIKKTLKSLDA